MFNYDSFSLNFAILLLEIERRGIQLEYIHGSDIIQATFEQHSEYFHNELCRLVPAVYTPIFLDRFYTKIFLKNKNYPVAHAQIFFADQSAEALNYIKNNKAPLTIKPVMWHKNAPVFHIHSLEIFEKHFYKLTQSQNAVLIEERIDGNHYQFCIVGNKEISMIRLPLQSENMNTLIFEQPHPSYLTLAKNIHNLFPGSHLTCFNIICPNISLPYEESNYVISEFALYPEFYLHQKKYNRCEPNIVNSLVNLLFPKTKPSPFQPSHSIPRFATYTEAANYHLVEHQGIMFINSSKIPSYQSILNHTIKNMNFTDLIVVCTHNQLKEIFAEAFLKIFNPYIFCNDLLRDLSDNLVEYANSFSLPAVEIHMQRRLQNKDRWHTDGIGSEYTTNPFTINFAQTIAGEEGTLIIPNNCIDRKKFVQMRAHMDKAYQNNDDYSFHHWSALKDYLCDTSYFYQIPVSQVFLFTTGRQYGLVHKPPINQQWRLFIKARPASSRNTEYLNALEHPTGQISARGYEIKVNQKWL